MPSAIRPGRVGAVLAFALAVGCVAVALALAPPLLEGFILADRDVGGGKATALAWLASVSALAAGWFSFSRARRGWRSEGGSWKRARRGLALAAIVLGLGVLLVEGALRLVLKTPEQRRERLLVGDEYWIARWLESSNPLIGENGESGEIGGLHRRDPRLGWVPNAHVRDDGVTTNSLGLRGSAEIASSKAAGERRVVVLGDSFTFGEGVKDEDVWVARMQTHLPGVTVANLGVMGYALDQQCLRLEDLGMKLAPDVVVLGLFGPDLDRDELTFRDDAKPRFELEDGGGGDGTGLRLSNVPVPDRAASSATLKPPQVGSFAFALARKAFLDARDATRFAPKWELARRILDRMKRTSEAGGARFVVAYFPAKPNSFDRVADAHEVTVIEWATARDVPLVNLRETFVGLGSSSFKQVWSGHWTPFGNDLVARTVASFLTTSGVLPR